MTDVPTPAAPARPRHWRRATAALGLLAALAASGWWWSGREGSLATGLQLASTLLPEGMALQTSGVQGSLRRGGRIDTLQWRQDGLHLQLQVLELQLDMGRLWQGQLPLEYVRLGRLEGERQTAPTATAPITQWVWPLPMALVWQIDHLHWRNGTTLEASALQGHYRFDGQQHQLQLDHMQWTQGHYSAQLQLQARAPMDLQVRLQGELTLPTERGTPHKLQAQASLQGPLAGPQARLALQAQLSGTQPDAGPGATPDSAPQLALQGVLLPQATQPVSELQAQLRQLDLAMLWPGAPQTQLDGHVQARPEAAGWRLEVDLRNRLTGAWDQGRIPLQQLQGQLLHGASGWELPTLLARWPGGGAQGAGRWQTGDWQGNWQIERLQPGQWLKSLQGPALSGQVRAEHKASDGLHLAVQLHPDAVPAPPATAVASTREASHARAGLDAQARWHQGRWSVPRLELHWAGAHLQAEGQWQPEAQALLARAQWQLPGLNGQRDGQLSPSQGRGQWLLAVQDAMRLRAWVQGWPNLKQSLPDWALPTAMQAEGQWQGGWTGDGLQLQARLASPRLNLSTQATLAQQPGNGLWRGQIRQLQLDWPERAGAAAPQQLQLQLQTPLDWQWQPHAQGLQWQAQRWVLQGLDQTAALAIGPGQWRAPLRAGSLPTLRLQASVSQLPLQWAQLSGWRPPSGNLLLQGQLELQLDAQQPPRLLARLERSSGDVQLGGDLPGTPRIQAGLRAARALLQVEGEQARLTLDWDSAQAGQLEARMQSRLNTSLLDSLETLWPANAPLSGQVQARLPRVGAWAWLAPPGWRVQGSMDANFQLAGTRAQPQWTGTLQADNLAVRSAVEGIEFRQGQLRARLQEQQVLLDELRLLGAGDQGGEVSAQGQVRWLPHAGNLLQAVQMDLQMQAKGLRLSNRADRRLSVSGQVNARLAQGQMQLRGQLQADSAQFILPDGSTPTLDKDVHILGRPTPAAGATQALSGSLMPTPDVQVLFNLGPDFLLHGQGLTTRLTGEVQLSSSAATGGQPRLVGQVRTEGGRYQAWGQSLHIERGLLRFVGPYDNPGLDILALRPNLGQAVGVQVSGTVQNPRIRLYADPDMPDADKLAWLVLGRSPAAGGAESAVLQQAALALLSSNGKTLGGELASALGFDEISLGSRSTTTAAGTTATGTTVMLGKRLSKDFYLAYESSVSGAFGNLFIFYDLSRKLSLRAQTGEINALDLIWSIRHD